MPIRWRNPDGLHVPTVLHRAGPVIACREYRRSCPGYVVDRRQGCADCGRELVRGKWAVFFLEGATIEEIGVGNRAPIFTYASDLGHTPRCA